MSVEQVLGAIWRRRWLAVLILTVFLGISVGITLLLPQVYRATATLRVYVPETTPDWSSKLKAGQDLARTYTELLKSPNVYSDTVEQQGLSVTPSQLRGATEISNVEGTELIQIQVEDPDPRQASDLANAVGQNISDEYQNPGREELVLADPAPIPAGSESPSLKLNIVLALLLGTVTSLAAVLLVEYFSNRLTSPEKIVDAGNSRGVRHHVSRPYTSSQGR